MTYRVIKKNKFAIIRRMKIYSCNTEQMKSKDEWTVARPHQSFNSQAPPNRGQAPKFRRTLDTLWSILRKKLVNLMPRDVRF